MPIKDDHKPEDAPARPELPKKLVITAARYGFYDENGRYREWRGGDVIVDPSEIALLMQREPKAGPFRIEG